MKLRITPGAALLLFVMALTGSPLLSATLSAALLHECGHLLAARLLGVRLKLLELDIPGARLVPMGTLPSYRAEGLLAAAGPTASLLLALLTLPCSGAFALHLRTATLSLALFNLLPIFGFDGGRVLLCLLVTRLSEQAARRVLAVTSYLSLLLLFSLSSCLLLRFGENLSLAVLSASLFARLFLLEPGSERAIE